MSTPPWTKDFKDIKRYDWLTAVNISPKHWDKPRDLRLANCLMQHMNADTGLSFPTQETMAKWTRLSGDRQVREAVYSLERSGAITRKRMDELQPEVAELVMKIGHRSRRAVVYRLNLFWAFETFEAYQSQLQTGPSESGILKAARMQHRLTTGRYDRLTTGRYKPAHDRPANTVGYTVDKLISAGSDKVPFNGREGRIEIIDPLIMTPPDDPAKARLWLFHICSDKSRLAEALGKLAMNQLTPEYIREISS